MWTQNGIFEAVVSRFNVRAYGILLHRNKILVSDEYIRGMAVTKFPGGGLEFGEGLLECLVREFREELGMEVETSSHFYTTDFFVASAFDHTSQVISVYYNVTVGEPEKIPVTAGPHEYEKKHGAQVFRWIPLNELSEDDLTLAIDKKVAGLVAENHRNG